MTFELVDHIPIGDAPIPKRTLMSPFDKYQYLKVSFGIVQAPAYFQELMNKVFMDLPFTIAYLDDIIIFSKTVEEHLKHLQQVLHKFQDAKLSLKLSKCHCFTKEIQYLGHILSITSITLLPLKTEGIKVMKPPRNAKQV